jgi:hypothetical protein
MNFNPHGASRSSHALLAGALLADRHQPPPRTTESQLYQEGSRKKNIALSSLYLLQIPRVAI